MNTKIIHRPIPEYDKKFLEEKKREIIQKYDEEISTSSSRSKRIRLILAKRYQILKLSRLQNLYSQRVKKEFSG
ncbi:MAG: hypothetical protein PHO94_11650 [Petrimonas sp.]|nr:hypothetical protein [Petrimonas sp.]